MKVLQVIQSAYRCTVEEQDDPAVWITHAMRGAGAELSVLLRGNAVNYAVQGQDASGLAFGGVPQTQPPRLDRDIAGLPDKSVQVFAVAEDLAARGIDPMLLVAGVETVPASAVPRLFADHDRVWSW